MRVVAFHRVSTDKQGESGLGIEAQEQAIEHLCASQGWEIVSSHTETGVSGSAPLTDRTELLEAIASASVHQADALVVAKLDRLTRDPLVQMTLERALAKKGVRIVSAAGEGTGGDEPSEVLMRRILSAVAENEAALVSVRTKAALQAKKLRGERLGRPPFGFKVQSGMLVQSADFQWVQRVMELRDQRQTYKEIASTLQDEDPTGTWSYGKVSRIVHRWGPLNELNSL